MDVKNSKEYKVEAIQNCAIYANKAKAYLSSLYYLVKSKSYSKKKIGNFY